MKIILPLLLMITSCSTTRPIASHEDWLGSVKMVDGGKVLTFHLKEENCEMSWIYTKSNSFVEHGSLCNRTLQDQLPMMAVMFRAVSAHLGKDRPFNDFFIGRLMKTSPDLAQRLALAAKRYEYWDTRTGKPNRGNRNGTVVSILSREEFRNEYRDLFKQFGLALEVDFVQEVSVAPASKIPFFHWLKSQGVSDGDYLPYDSRVGFSVHTGTTVSQAEQDINY